MKHVDDSDVFGCMNILISVSCMELQTSSHVCDRSKQLLSATMTLNHKQDKQITHLVLILENFPTLAE